MAIRHDRILIEKNNIPYRFTIALPRNEYELEIRYNETIDLFTIGLYKSNSLLCIEPIIYGAQLFKYLYKPGIFPALCIVPRGNNDTETRVTWDNFGETVFLEIENMGG